MWRKKFIRSYHGWNWVYLYSYAFNSTKRTNLGVERACMCFLHIRLYVFFSLIFADSILVPIEWNIWTTMDTRHIAKKPTRIAFKSNTHKTSSDGHKFYGSERMHRERFPFTKTETLKRKTKTKWNNIKPRSIARKEQIISLIFFQFNVSQHLLHIHSFQSWWFQW